MSRQPGLRKRDTASWSKDKVHKLSLACTLRVCHDVTFVIITLTTGGARGSICEPMLLGRQRQVMTQGGAV